MTKKQIKPTLTPEFALTKKQIKKKETHKLYMREWRKKRKDSGHKDNAKALKPKKNRLKKKKYVVTNVGELKPIKAKRAKLTPEQKKEEHKLYMRIWRRKKKIAKLNKEKPKGFKTVRSKIYKEILPLNKEYKTFWVDLGYEYDKSEKQPIGVLDKGIIAESYTVWKFEDRLRDFLKEGTFMYYFFENINKTYNFKLHFISTILNAWDEVLDAAYLSGGTTPVVYVIEDYNKSKISITVVF